MGFRGVVWSFVFFLLSAVLGGAVVVSKGLKPYQPFPVLRETVETETRQLLLEKAGEFAEFKSDEWPVTAERPGRKGGRVEITQFEEMTGVKTFNPEGRLVSVAWEKDGINASVAIDKDGKPMMLNVYNLKEPNASMNHDLVFLNFDREVQPRYFSFMRDDHMFYEMVEPSEGTNYRFVSKEFCIDYDEGKKPLRFYEKAAGETWLQKDLGGDVAAQGSFEMCESFISNATAQLKN